jgi:hypothetical protein
MSDFFVNRQITPDNCGDWVSSRAHDHHATPAGALAL